MFLNVFESLEFLDFSFFTACYWKCNNFPICSSSNQIYNLDYYLAFYYVKWFCETIFKHIQKYDKKIERIKLLAKIKLSSIESKISKGMQDLLQIETRH